MKKSVFKALLPTMAMILVAVMALTGTTYAWFTNTRTASITSFDVKVTTASSMKVAIVKDGSVTTEPWTNTLTIAEIASSANASMPDYANGFEAVSSVTGKNGTFYTAKISETDSTKLVEGTLDASPAIKFELYLWNDSNENRIVSLSGSDITSATAGVVNALRVSVVDWGTVKSNYTDGASFDTSAVSTTEGTAKIWEPAGSSGVAAISGAFTGPIAKDDSTKTATQNTEGAAANVGVNVPAHSVEKVVVYIWLEGQDPDCINAITGKTASIALKLDGETTY